MILNQLLNSLCIGFALVSAPDEGPKFNLHLKVKLADQLIPDYTTSVLDTRDSFVNLLIGKGMLSHFRNNFFGLVVTRINDRLSQSFSNMNNAPQSALLVIDYREPVSKKSAAGYTISIEVCNSSFTLENLDGRIMNKRTRAESDAAYEWLRLSSKELLVDQVSTLSAQVEKAIDRRIKEIVKICSTK